MLFVCVPDWADSLSPWSSLFTLRGHCSQQVGWPGTPAVLRDGSLLCGGAEELVRSGQELGQHKDSHRLDVTNISVHTTLLHS